jgi:hypothetical protein
VGLLFIVPENGLLMHAGKTPLFKPIGLQRVAKTASKDDRAWLSLFSQSGRRSASAWSAVVACC